jgi:GT2 family glycosyltransferase
VNGLPAASRPATDSDANRPVVSVIVVNWNTRDLLRECLASARKHLWHLSNEIIVVDNGSSDGSAALVAAEFPEVRLIRNPDNLGFGRANNQAMAIGRGEFFLLLNSDARLPDDSIRGLLPLFANDRELGVVGPRIEDARGNLQPSAFRFGSIRLLILEELGLYKLMPKRRVAELFLGGYWDHRGEHVADWVVGACMLVRREIFETTGGFDPTLFLYGEEEEWCRRIHSAGWKVVYSPKATVVHLGHQTTHRYLGETERIVRCLDSADQMLARRSSRALAFLVPGIRITGALLKLARVRVSSLLGSSRASDDSVRELAQIVLRHYTSRPWS